MSSTMTCSPPICPGQVVTGAFLRVDAGGDLGIAYEFDPYFGLSISRVDPLPHQLEAVYDFEVKGLDAATGTILLTPNAGHSP